MSSEKKPQWRKIENGQTFVKDGTAQLFEMVCRVQAPLPPKIRVGGRLYSTQQYEDNMRLDSGFHMSFFNNGHIDHKVIYNYKWESLIIFCPKGVPFKAEHVSSYADVGYRCAKFHQLDGYRVSLLKFGQHKTASDAKKACDNALDGLQLFKHDYDDLIRYYGFKV